MTRARRAAGLGRVPQRRSADAYRSGKRRSGPACAGGSIIHIPLLGRTASFPDWQINWSCQSAAYGTWFSPT